MQMDRGKPPEADELELSLFGPGVGEAVLLHLGDGSWLAVDSCVDRTTNEPVALRYLNSLGVDVSRQLKLIVATHWHDDHIQGLARLLTEGSSAKFACSASLNSEEFFGLVAAGEHAKLVAQKSGVREFSRVLDVLNERQPDEPSTAGPDYWSTAGMTLFEDSGCLVKSLSPSHQTVTDMKGQLAGLMPEIGAPIRSFPKIRSLNDLSVVLSVESHGFQVLLGADLEVGSTDRRGWRAIVSNAADCRSQAFAFKVPHHGSPNAHMDDVWEKLLVTNPYSVLTPYARGCKSLPSEEDVQRIISRTEHLFCTAWPPTKTPPRRDKSVDRTLNEIARNRRARRMNPGQIRIRRSAGAPSAEITVELFDGAVRL